MIDIQSFSCTSYTQPRLAGECVQEMCKGKGVLNETLFREFSILQVLSKYVPKL